MRIAMSHRLFCLNLHPRRVQGGVSLIIVLIMLVIIGLTSAAAMRSATSAEKVTNSVRLQNLAQQYAEAALRYCEAQLALPAPVATLDAANIVTTYSGDPNPPVAWQNTQTWGGGGGANASLTVTPASWVYSADSTNLKTGQATRVRGRASVFHDGQCRCGHCVSTGQCRRRPAIVVPDHSPGL
jgi:Tfp pilus assembly protein PilX